MAKEPKPAAAATTPAPAATTPPAPWDQANTPAPAASTSEPPAGTPMTAEEREANGLPPETVETPEGGLVQTTPPEVAPVEDQLTLGDGEGAEQDELPADMPTGDDGRPDGFVPGDQTAAGAFTPPGGRHPGAPKGLQPGESINLQDPHNVNGTARNQELLAAGHGIRNPALDKDA